MEAEEHFLLGVLISLAIFSVVVAFWPPFRAKRNRHVPMGRRGPVVRVPRIPSWDRARKVYGDTQ